MDKGHFANLAGGLSGKTIAIAGAADGAVMETLVLLQSEQQFRAALFDHAPTLEAMLQQYGITNGVEVHHSPTPEEAAVECAAMAGRGEAQIVMKGQLNSRTFLKGILSKEGGLRTNRRLCHVMALDIPVFNKLTFHTDGGMNQYPSLEEKEEILYSTIAAVQRLGVAVPKVAVLSANEIPDPTLPSSMDAAALMERFRAGAFPQCIMEGPVSMDVAISAEAAAHKGIQSEICGDVDIFLYPNIDAGNMSVKVFQNAAHALSAGIVLGAAVPVVLTSRAEFSLGKCLSVYFAAAC